MAIVVPTDAYCELTDVAALVPRRTFSSTSKPTDAQAEETIKAIAREINARLRRHDYTVPVTDAEGKALLKRVNARGAAYEIELSLRESLSGTIEGSVAEFGRLYERDLKAIERDEMDLGAGSPAASAKPAGLAAVQAGGKYENPIFDVAAKF